MKALRNWLQTAAHRWERLKYSPDIAVATSGELLRLGTPYGGWCFEPSPDLRGATIISCGLGEDASFDAEFARRFDARVIVVDPTPRAIAHFQEIRDRIGKPATRKYVHGGKQPADAYELGALTPESLVMVPCAIWTEITRVKFFTPANPAHVSHSIVNYQNKYSNDGEHLDVQTTTLPELLHKYDIPALSLIKLDIEGAEIDVIGDMLNRAIYPRQILVEFDEMNAPSPRSKQNAENVDGKLRRAGYQCRHFDGMANFLYVRH